MTESPAFLVFWTPEALASAKDIRELARAAGRIEDFLRALRTIQQRLGTDPLAFGEVYLSRGNVHRHTAGDAFVIIDFTICTERKMVLVHRCGCLEIRRS